MVSTTCGYLDCSLCSAQEGERPCCSCLLQLREPIRQASSQIFSQSLLSSLCVFFFCLFVSWFVFLKDHESFECQLNFTYLFLYFQSFEAPTKNKPTVGSSVKVDSEKTKNKYHTYDQKGKQVLLTSCTYLE